MPSPSDLLTTPTDIALRSPSIIERPRVVDQGALDQVDAGTSELGRGFTSGLRSSLAASQASVGAALDYAGLRNAASSWYQDAATNAQRAQAAQPFVNDLRSISSPADVPSYVAGKIGEMAPAAIPAIAAGAVGGPIAATHLLTGAPPILWRRQGRAGTIPMTHAS